MERNVCLLRNKLITDAVKPLRRSRKVLRSYANMVSSQLFYNILTFLQRVNIRNFVLNCAVIHKEHYLVSQSLSLSFLSSSPTYLKLVPKDMDLKTTKRIRAQHVNSHKSILSVLFSEAANRTYLLDFPL